jgi:non-ribosomal peptide synthase protein (TIGR01720 family)
VSRLLDDGRAGAAPDDLLAQLLGEEPDEGAPAAGEPVPVDLVPLQRNFLGWVSRGVTPLDRWTMSQLLDAGEELDPGRLERALAAVVAYHPALRLRIGADEGGRWSAAVVPGRRPAFRTVSLRDVPPERQDAAIAEVAEAEHAGLDLGTGPVLRAVLFDRAGGSRVLFVVHHVAFDQYSWWILIEDLEAAYADLFAYEAGHDAGEDGEYPRWAGAFREYAASEAAAAARAFWLPGTAFQAPPPPLDFPDGLGENREGAARQLWTRLTAEQTAALLSVVRQEGLDPQAALLAALHHAWTRWTGERRMAVMLVSHGRGTPLASLRTSRMVGCAAHSYPVAFELPATCTDPLEAARRLADQLGAVPNQGVDYGILRFEGDPETQRQLAAVPVPGIALNFAGTFSSELGGSLFRTTDSEMSDQRRDARAVRLVFNVDAVLEDGALASLWRYGPSIHRRETVESLAEDFRAALVAIAERRRP